MRTKNARAITRAESAHLAAVKGEDELAAWAPARRVA